MSQGQDGGEKPSFPSGATTIEALTNETDASGTVAVGGGYGYLASMPENSFTGVATVKAVAAPGIAPVAGDVTAGNAGGWIYDASTGNIWLDSNTSGEFAW